MSKKMFFSANEIIPSLELLNSSTVTSTSYGAWMNGDGTKVYSFRTARTVEQFELSTPYDLTTKSLVINKDLSAGTVVFLEGRLTSDGTKIFIMGVSGSTTRVYKFSVSVPYDLTSTVTLLQTWNVTNNLSVNTYAFELNQDGTILWVADNGTLKNILKFELSTPYDLNTILYIGVAYAWTGNIDFFNFYNEGTRLLIGGRNVGFQIFSVSVPYDLTSTVTELISPTIYTDVGGFANNDGHIVTTKGSTITMFNNTY